ILMVLKTGLRHGELKALNWADINWNNKTLTVRHSWCEYRKALDSPKSNRERHIPLTNELYEMLAQRKQAEGPVFLDERKQRFNSKRLNQEISKACKKAGLREITCHTLRHTFASHLAMAGAPLKVIQELMGHANIQTTMRYAHLSSSSLRETIKLLEPKRAILNFGQQVVNVGQHPFSIAVDDRASNSG
ncbi:site-specific integrase, partial [Patescibacteria group bacterium]|nr:site-specific integrase [Patescibacteria group bacterium]